MSSVRRVLAVLIGVVLSITAMTASAQAKSWSLLEAFSAGPGFGTRGLAVNQSNGHVYTSQFEFPDNGIREFDELGSPLGHLAKGTSVSGLAVNPTNQNVYGYGALGSLITYDSAGNPAGSPFAVEADTEPYGAQLAADAAGNVYFANTEGDSVQKFDPTGMPLLTVTGSEAHTLDAPTGVAVAADGSIYVADAGQEGRVQKFDSAGNYVSTLESGAGSVAVAVNTLTGDVFVLDRTDGYRVVAYDSAGVELDSFGLGAIGDSGFTYNQVAVNSTTESVYVTDGANQLVWIYAVAEPPAVTTAAASAIAQAKATLNGTVNPNGGEVTDCHFEYGTTESYGSEAACVPAPGAGTEAVAVHADVTGLSPKQDYHFRLVAENEGGTAEGDDETLTTLPSKPVVSGESAGGVTEHGAALSGTVNPNGAATTCEFEYGTSTSYGTKVPCTSSPGSGEAPVAVSIPALSGLSAGTTYHFRINATSAGGTTNGTDQTFATLADTCQTNSALCPPAGGGGGGSTPPATSGPPPSKPMKCRKGFKKKKVKGKTKCVKLKKKKGRR